MRINVAFVFLLCSLTISSALASEIADNCDAAASRSTSSNALELWNGASSCATSGDMTRATFLLLAGQIRGMTDIAVLNPATDEDKIKIGEFYGVLYYQAGGSGDDELLQDQERTSNLIRELRAWNPALTDTYDPGWAYKSNVDIDYYTNMIACQKEVRIDKLEWYSRLLRNDDYYEAKQDLQKFQSDNPGTMTVGTEEHDTFQEIFARMNSHSSDVPMPSQLPPECEFAKHYEPDQNADFKQLFTGSNGPGDSGAAIFTSSDEILSSWISKALSENELGELLSEVNFDNQIVVSLTFGERQNATGTIYLSEVDYNSIHQSLQVSGLIGVTEPGCDEPYAKSYPFVLGVAPRPETVPSVPSMFLQNFGDGCKPIMSGTQTLRKE